ncbi:MAG: 6-bladed beta-propeller, partial [Proteobacteria bacterium]|nr:6-bladed beta-propeller [Pseudomonadota bacterium]
VKVAPDGSIFMEDRELLLRFDANGQFIHNFFKKGQGPGELIFIGDYDFQGGELIVIGSNPEKILTFDFNGELLDEVVLHDVPLFTRFQFLSENRLFFFKNERPETGDKPGVFDAPHVLMSMDKDGKNMEEHISLPYQLFMTGGAIMGLGRLTTVPYKNSLLAISHTEEYLVKLYDVESQTMLRSFTRKYKRVKPPKDYRWGGIYGRDGKRMGPPPPEFLYDINALYVVNDTIWVRTSTKDEDKGYLIDVYDLDGRFMDSFYLKTDGGIVSTHESTIFIKEADEDELVSIVKYRIVQK